MKSQPSLVDMPTSDLERVARLLRQEGESAPLSAKRLEAWGASHMWAALEPMAADASAARWAIGAILAERIQSQEPRIALVWSGPKVANGTARSTAILLEDMIAKAQHHIFLAGYAFDLPASFFRPLLPRMKNAELKVEILINTEWEPNKMMQDKTSPEDYGEFFMRHRWPDPHTPPSLFYDTRTQQRETHISMHAKCVVVDGSEALVGSANFTDRAHQRNLEVGAHIFHPPFCQELLAQWQAALRTGVLAPIIL